VFGRRGVYGILPKGNGANFQMVFEEKDEFHFVVGVRYSAINPKAPSIKHHVQYGASLGFS